MSLAMFHTCFRLEERVEVPVTHMHYGIEEMESVTKNWLFGVLHLMLCVVVI